LIAAGSHDVVRSRRPFDWWLVQVRHVLPPTIFFLGFNLILFARWMTLLEHGIPIANFFAATLAAPHRVGRDPAPAGGAAWRHGDAPMAREAVCIP